ncbi:MAG: CHAP domain-containing protein, partial [Ruminiclostridium sp.]|nr:CHAP domain-containing protein [Ruminiclostridium sp.]
MKDIKTKESIKDIKVLDKAAGLVKVTKNATVQTNQQVQNLSDDARITPDEYAEDKVKYMAETVAEGTGKAAKQTVNNIYDGGNRLYREIRRTRKEAETARSAAKTLHKCIKTGRQSIKTAQHTTKTTVKTAQQTAKAAKKTAEATAKSSKMAAQAARQAAQATYKATVVTAKAAAAAVKSAIAGIKALAAAIAAGGFVSVVIIIIICIIALIAGSCFGIFFSGDDTGSGMTMQTVISDINAEYEAKINETKGTVAYDVLEMSGSRAVWPEVLSVYAVKTAGDPNNPQEVASIDEGKRQILKDVSWAMNEISFFSATKTENVVTETDDGNGNIVETTESVTRTYLYIRVTHKSADEMAQQYGFTDEQKEQLRELLSDENKKMWSGVLYGYYTGGEDIV